MPKHSKIRQWIKTSGLRTKTQQERLHDIKQALDRADWLGMKSSLLSLQTAKRPAVASKTQHRAKIKVGEEHHVDLSLLAAPVRRGSIQNYKHAALSEVPMAKIKILSKRRKRSLLQLELIHLLEIIDELDMPSLYDIELRVKNIFYFDDAMGLLEKLYDKQKWKEADDILLYLCDTFNVFRAKLGIPH